MLVLSRRVEEKIVFPQLGITVHVLGVRGNTVRIGVEAPPEVKVLREELAAAPLPAPAPAAPKRPAPAPSLSNRLQKIGVLTNLLDRQWAAGHTREAQATLKRLTQLLASLDRECPATPSGGPAPAKKAARRTLVVEDDANERELLAGLLRLSGCECDAAEDGQAALDFLASHERPDFVLLDMFMPRCDGPETVARIRRDPRLADLKIFAVSGTSPRDLGVTTGPDGVDAWFPKPLNPQTFWDSIQKQLTAVANHN